MRDVNHSTILQIDAKTMKYDSDQQATCPKPLDPMKFPFNRCWSSLLWCRSSISLLGFWNFNGGKMLEEEGDQSLPIREWKMPTFLHIPYPLFIASTHLLMGLLQISPLAFQNLNSQLKNLKTAISPKPLNQILNVTTLRKGNHQFLSNGTGLTLWFVLRQKLCPVQDWQGQNGHKQNQ